MKVRFTKMKLWDLITLLMIVIGFFLIVFGIAIMVSFWNLAGIGQVLLGILMFIFGCGFVKLGFM